MAHRDSLNDHAPPSTRKGNRRRAREEDGEEPPPAKRAKPDPDLTFFAACAAGLLAMVQMYATAGNVNKRDAMGQTPLILAARRKGAAVIRHLISVGADVNAVVVGPQPRSRPLTAVGIAAGLGWAEGVEILKEAGASTPVRWERVMKEAIMQRSAVDVKRCANYVELNPAICTNELPIYVAAKLSQKRYSTESMLRLLISLGANVNLALSEPPELEGETALMAAADVESIGFLLDHGAHVDARDKDGRTALRRLIEYLKVDDDHNWEEGMLAITLLLEQGADRHARDAQGMTPVMVAWPREDAIRTYGHDKPVFNGHPSLRDFLVNFHQDVTVTGHGNIRKRMVEAEMQCATLKRQNEQLTERVRVAVAREKEYQQQLKTLTKERNELHTRLSARASDDGLHVIKAEELAYSVKLGNGGLGEVWAARWLGAKVAVKRVLHAHNVHGLRREIDALNHLRSPYLVQFFGYTCAADGELESIVMERLSPVSLADAAQAPHLVSLCVARGLMYLHGRRIIHRDIKLSNTLYDAEKQIYKISDLGEAKVLDRISAHQTRGRRGTPVYMAPEIKLIVEGELPTPAVDIFSFGVMMLEVHTGHHPNPTGPESRRVNARLTEPVPEVVRRRDDLARLPAGSAVRSFVERCLDNNPDARPDAAECAAFFNVPT